MKGRASKRRSSSSRKDGSQRRKSSSRKESSEARGIRDGEHSLPRKYSRHNSGESLSHARKMSGARSSHTRTSKDDQGTEQDTKGEEWTMQDNKIDEMRDDEQVLFTVSLGVYVIFKTRAGVLYEVLFKTREGVFYHT